MKKYGKALAIVCFVGFVIANIVTYNHAYKFTHFNTDGGARTADPDSLTLQGKVSILFTGISNPKPSHSALPRQSYETVYIQSSVKLEAWRVSTPQAIGTVILFHGYAGDKSQLLSRSDEFLSMGYNTLLVDFMGSGGSEGNHTTIGYEEAAQGKAALDYVRSSGDANVVLFGTSMGAAAILKMIDDYHDQPAAIILECPFGSLYKTIGARFDMLGVPSFPAAAMLSFWGSVQCGFWVFDHNPSEYAIAVQCPTLLIYGELDDRVSREETDAIFTNLSGPKVLKTYGDAGHFLFVPETASRWVTDVDKFLLEWNATPGSGQ